MFKKNLKKKATLGAIILAAALAFAGCSGKGLATNTNAPVAQGNYKLSEPSYAAGDNYTNDYDVSYDIAPGEYTQPAGGEVEGEIDGLYDNSGSGTGTLVDQGAAQKRKLIRTVDLEVETKEYDKLMGDVEKKIEELGGYIENEYSYNGSSYQTGNNVRYATMVVRIPDNKLNEFVNTMSGMSNVVSRRTSAQDVTLQYTDIESKRDMYEAEQESLLALLEKAETVEDITYLTQRLTEVRYSIESMERQLRVYDNQVDYSTINLDIHEVEVLTPQKVEVKTDKEEVEEGYNNSWENIGNAFRNFGKNFVIKLPYLILTLAILAVNALIIVIVVNAIKRKVKKARLANQKAAEEKAKAMEAAQKAQAEEAVATENK